MKPITTAADVRPGDTVAYRKYSNFGAGPPPVVCTVVKVNKMSLTVAPVDDGQTFRAPYTHAVKSQTWRGSSVERRPNFTRYDARDRWLRTRPMLPFHYNADAGRGFVSAVLTTADVTSPTLTSDLARLAAWIAAMPAANEP